MAERESISEADMELLFVTDSVHDLIKHIDTYAIKEFGLTKKASKPKWWYGEKLKPNEKE